MLGQVGYRAEEVVALSADFEGAFFGVAFLFFAQSFSGFRHADTFDCFACRRPVLGADRRSLYRQIILCLGKFSVRNSFLLSPIGRAGMGEMLFRSLHQHPNLVNGLLPF